MMASPHRGTAGRCCGTRAGAGAGTGIYRSIGGDGTLVEFGNGKGRLTLHVLSLVSRGGGA